MSLYNNILVAIDLSESSLKTVEKAVEFAQFFGAQVTLCHIVESTAYNGYPRVNASNF